MCYGFVVTSLILSFLLIGIDGENGSQEQILSLCVNKSKNEAELILNDENPVISASLIDLCSQNITSLVITEGLQNKERLIYGEFFLHEKVINLKELDIRVQRLAVRSLRSSVEQSNVTSDLRSLTISNCNLSLPILGAFCGLFEVRSFVFKNCSLNELPADLLVHSPRLKLIDLTENQFQFLPSLLNPQNNTHTNPTINVANNPILCSCVNSWIHSQGSFVGSPTCVSEIESCKPFYEAQLRSKVAIPKILNESLNLPVFASHSFNLTCSLNSTVPGEIYWITPIGVIPPASEIDGATHKVYTYSVQPIIAPTLIQVSWNSSFYSELGAENARGHLSGKWYCVGHFAFGISVSSPVQVEVISSIYHAQVYVLSLCYGYGAMAVLLLVGILGGTIRYCSETRCLRRPQPPFAYGGKTFIGVIPVPQVDDESCDGKSNANRTYDINEGSMQYVSAGRICNICLKPPTYWFCNKCKAVHFVESVHELKAADVLQVIKDPPEGDLLQEGEIQIINLPQKPSSLVDTAPTEATTDSPEVHRLLCGTNNADHPAAAPPISSHCDDSGYGITPVTMEAPYLYVRSGDCVVRVRGEILGESKEARRPFEDLQSLKNAICFHPIHRPKSADVKLVVSNDKLAEEYREALADLARAVESPDPNHFREHLEEFRSRLRRDVGHGVKVLRGEFQGFCARSAKGVANLRTQSSAAAQRMRAGFSHGVEQVKEGMRSVAELCGASGTIGQTISVVSVYVDEADQTKKERFVSNFVF